MMDWTADDWRVLEDLLRLDGFRLHHCGHCDRHPDADPAAHPSCVIVPEEG